MSSSALSSSSLSWTAANGDFEVAKVLASLGKQKAAADDGGDDGGGGGTDESVSGNCWGNKGNRTSTRLRTDSELDDPSARSSGPGPNSVPLPFDLNTVDQDAMYDEDEEDNKCEDGNIKVEEVCESAEPEPGLVTNGGRSRQNLTKSEKEARRIRRILANRESARQTIRRRQALYEELTRKAEDLASESENLKKSKELVVKEFQSLQSTNLNLKNQVSQTLGFNLRENRGEASISSGANTGNVLSANWPFFICNKFSANSFIWTSPNVNLVQLNQHNINHFPSKEQENPLNVNGQSMPWCVLTCPWFLPISKPEEAFADAKHGLSPRSILNRPSVLPADVKPEAHTLKEGKSKNGVVEDPFGFPSSNPLPSTGFQTASALSEKGKKVDAKAGADARKRRRELMKLKTLHCHPTRGGYGETQLIRFSRKIISPRTKLSLSVAWCASIQGSSVACCNQELPSVG